MAQGDGEGLGNEGLAGWFVPGFRFRSVLHRTVRRPGPCLFEGCRVSLSLVAMHLASRLAAGKRQQAARSPRGLALSLSNFRFRI